MSDLGYFAAKILGDLLGRSASAGSPVREVRAYRKAFKVASRSGDFNRAVLSTEFKTAAVPGAYDDPARGRLASAFHCWDSRVPPAEFAKLRKREHRKEMRIVRRKNI